MIDLNLVENMPGPGEFKVTGEAFESSEGDRFSITGAINGNMLSFTAVNGATTANFSGDVTFAADGSPDDVTGAWVEGANTGTFKLVGCRLN